MVYRNPYDGYSEEGAGGYSCQEEYAGCREPDSQYYTHQAQVFNIFHIDIILMTVFGSSQKDAPLEAIEFGLKKISSNICHSLIIGRKVLILTLYVLLALQGCIS